LTVIQFAILIGLLVATGTIDAQMRYAIDRAIAGGENAVLVVRTDCTGAFPEAVRQLPGVRGAACSQSAPTNYDRRGTSATRPGSDTSLQIDLSIVDFGFFELYGLTPLAGRVFSRDFPADTVSDDASQPFSAPLVLNESAVGKFGFRSPADAVGKELRLGHVRNAQPSRIIGVVPDFPVESLREAVGATAFYIEPKQFRLLSIGLPKESLAGSVGRIEALWSRTSGAGRPLDSFFIDSYVRDVYSQMRLQGALFGALSVVAVTIACIGLFSLAALTAQWRTREIGIRKALGAEKRDVVWLLMWQFAKPVLWANAIAWPVAEIFLGRWLEGFTHHIALPWWLFIACGGMTLVLALAVVSVHTLRAASARPVQALRQE
jgi:putative ABC transport system permease protein